MTEEAPDTTTPCTLVGARLLESCLDALEGKPMTLPDAVIVTGEADPET